MVENRCQFWKNYDSVGGSVVIVNWLLLTGR